MPNPPQKQRFQIPDVIDPPNTVCLTMTIPDDPIHIANITGAIYQIAFGPNYTDDDAHSAKALSQVWRRYFSTLTIGDCPVPCPPGLIGGLLEDFEMPLRVDCDCNVWVTCCDGTEKQLLTADQVKALMVGQPGQGAPQPPAGGCTSYTGTLQANNRFFVPAVVNAGDVITVVKADGLTNDAVNAAWRNYAGDQVFAGFDIGGAFLNGTDILPTAFHLGLIVNIAGVYYPAYSPVTVPGGVVNAQPFLVINGTSPALLGGQMDLEIQVCNNQSSTWTHVFDFTLGPQGFFLSPVSPGYSGASGTYALGSGWKDNLVTGPGGDFIRVCQIISQTITPTPITGMSLQLSGSDGILASPPFGNALYVYNGAAVTVLRSDASSPFPTSPYAATHAPITSTAVAFDIVVGYRVGTGDPGGTVTAAKLTVTGTGTDPF